MNKRWILSVLVVISSLLSSCSSSPNSLIGRLFSRIINFASLNWLGLPGSIQFVTFTRVLIWILAFALYYAVLIMLGNSTNKPAGKGSSNFVTLHKGQAIAIAAVLATISAIYIPVAALLAIGSGWATMLSLLFIGAPVAGFAALLWAIPGKQENGEQTPEHKGHVFLKIVLTLILYWVLSSMYTHISQGIIVDFGRKSAVALAMGTALEWSLFFLTVLLIYYFFRLFVVDGLTDEERKEQSAREKEHYSNLIKRLTDPAKKNMELRSQRAKEAAEARKKRKEEEEASRKKKQEEEETRYTERRKKQEERRKAQEEARKKQQEEDKKKRAERAKEAKEKQEKAKYFSHLEPYIRKVESHTLDVVKVSTEVRDKIRRSLFLAGASSRIRTKNPSAPKNQQLLELRGVDLPNVMPLQRRVILLDRLLEEIWKELRHFHSKAKQDRDFGQQLRAQIEAVRGEFTDKVERFLSEFEAYYLKLQQYEVDKHNNRILSAASHLSAPITTPVEPVPPDQAGCIAALQDVRNQCEHIFNELEDFEKKFQ